MDQFYPSFAWLRSYWVKYIILLLCLTCFFELTGCRSKPVYPPIKPINSPERILEAQRSHYVETLLHEHIMVITLGETKRIIIPSDEIFYPYSANLFQNQCDKLDTVANLIASYQTEMVKVDAFTDSFFPIPISDALSKKQAQLVADYLRKQKMDTRFILRQGNGQLNPVASNQTPEERCYNRRIEITFRVYPPEPMY